MKIACVLFVLLTTVAWAGSPDFNALVSLEGTWEGSYQGDTIQLKYETISGGSAVMERMTWIPDGSSMTTVYYPQAERLMVTHYCKANQPRLVSVPSAVPGTLDFQFLDGANAGEKHLAHLRLKMINPNELEQTVRFAGVEKEITVLYKRIQ